MLYISTTGSILLLADMASQHFVPSCSTNQQHSQESNPQLSGPLYLMDFFWENFSRLLGGKYFAMRVLSIVGQRPGGRKTSCFGDTEN